MLPFLRRLAPAAAFLLAGCYAHAPVPVASAPAGASVRARVTGAESDRLGSVLGRDARVLSGSLVEVGGDSLLLQVPSAAGGASRGLNQRVRVPVDQVVELEVRRLDRVRTAGIVAAVAAVGAYVVSEQFSREPRDATSPDRPPANQAILVFRLPW